jgi:hypothetical protein
MSTAAVAAFQRFANLVTELAQLVPEPKRANLTNALERLFFLHTGELAGNTAARKARFGYQLELHDWLVHQTKMTLTSVVRALENILTARRDSLIGSAPKPDSVKAQWDEIVQSEPFKGIFRNVRVEPAGVSGTLTIQNDPDGPDSEDPGEVDGPSGLRALFTGGDHTADVYLDEIRLAGPVYSTSVPWKFNDKRRSVELDGSTYTFPDEPSYEAARVLIEKRRPVPSDSARSRLGRASK